MAKEGSSYGSTGVEGPLRVSRAGAPGSLPPLRGSRRPTERDDAAPGRPRFALVEGEGADALLSGLADVDSLKVLSSVTGRAKTVKEVTAERGLPASSTYKMVERMVKSGLIVVESRALSPSGKKRATYRSTITFLGLTIADGRIAVEVGLNPCVAERLNGARVVSLWEEGSRSGAPRRNSERPPWFK